MALQDKISVIDRKLFTDSRGWFLKVLTGFEEFLPNHTGECYMTMALPGEWRANHYHYNTSEWFTVFKGRAKVILEDIGTKERMEFILDEKSPKTLFVPANIAHVFVNISDKDEMMLLTYAENTYDPADTCQYPLIN